MINVWLSFNLDSMLLIQHKTGFTINFFFVCFELNIFLKIFLNVQVQVLFSVPCHWKTSALNCWTLCLFLPLRPLYLSAWSWSGNKEFFLYVSKNTHFFWENLTAVVESVFFISPRLLVFWLQSQCRLFAFSLLSYKPSFTLTAFQVLLTNSINWACVQDEVWQQWSVLFTSTKAWIHYSKAVMTQRCHFPSISPRQCCIVFVNYEFQPQSAHSPLK